MKEPIFRNDRIVVNSDWRTFNKQSNLIAAGAVWANTQHSDYIRPWRENGDAGIDFDLEFFSGHKIPELIERYIRNKQRSKSIILYVFFTTRGANREPFLWVVTDKNHRLIYRQTVTGYRRQWWKRHSATEKILPYITA